MWKGSLLCSALDVDKGGGDGEEGRAGTGTDRDWFKVNLCTTVGVSCLREIELQTRARAHIFAYQGKNIEVFSGTLLLKVLTRITPTRL